jgi:hypothetical protein
MKVRRLFRLQEVKTTPRYQLVVDGAPSGGSDFLGVEESLVSAPAGAILDLMIRNGVQRTTAAAFLWGFLEEKKQRQEAGEALSRWEKLLECEG